MVVETNQTFQDKKKTIALVAHDARKEDLAHWVLLNSPEIMECKIVATKTTGELVSRHLLDVLNHEDYKKIEFEFLKSGPLGGDQELGARITAGEIDMLIFLWDPMTMQPHDVDMKALLRLAVLYNIPTACNRATADYMISSPLFEDKTYTRIIKDYSQRMHREF